MSSIKAVLLDAEQQKHQNEKLRLYLWKLRYIFYDAEDVFNEFECEALRKQVVNHPSIIIKEMFNLGEGGDNRRVIRRETHSFVNSSDVIGRVIDRENIVNLLMKPRVETSLLFPLLELGRSLILLDCSSRFIYFISSERCEDIPIDALQTRLRSLLTDKKFLLVLDDVWNEDREKWIELRDLLMSTLSNLSQSKIIVTTRSLKVASIMSSVQPYELKGLPREDCLTLFRKWAFNERDERQYPNLIRIGQEIDHLYSNIEVIPFWMANGLLEYPKQNQEWEDVGSRYLNELWSSHSSLEALPISIDTLKYLRYLDLSECRNIKRLPSSFYKLRSLLMFRMGGIPLEQLPVSMHNLIKLRHLMIAIKAKHLKEIPPGCWSSLQYLALFDCAKLECLFEGMQYLISLRTFPRLILEGSASTLQHTKIGFFSNFEVLPEWLQNLTSLQKLEILDYPKLSSLPEGMNRLTALQQLKIERCPSLSERCRRDGGEDWPKIAHIQEVGIIDF
ncbi:hypothetical protein REPUB_Repub10bG0112100 [Reevesia pubescens]